MTRPPDQIMAVHVRSPSALPGRGRRLRRALGHARLHPASLPPSALLVVRTLDDPQPGDATAGTSARLAPEWERAARRALNAVARRAVHPRRGRVPEGAEAVVFADEAELLACVAVADARGERPWWARSVEARPVVPRLAERPAQGPAVLHHLAVWNEAARALADLRPEEAIRLLIVLCKAFDVPEDAVVRLHPSDGTRIPLRIISEVNRATSDPTRDALAAAVREVHRRVGPAQAVLLGIAITLVRAPHLLRTPEARPALRTRPDRPPEALTPQPPAGAPSVEPRDGVVVPPLAPPRANAGSPTVDPNLPSPPTEAPSPPADGAADPHTATDDDPPSEHGAWTRGTATAIGGILFLLPVMRALRLPDAFEADWRLASAVGAWGVLEALAHGLLGDAHAAHHADPLWCVLAHLDGREPAEPPRDARRLHPPRLPADWPLPDGPPPPGLAVLPDALAAWTHLALPAVQARLVDALDLAAADKIPDALLLRDGTLHTTTSHVDLVLPLASARLNVRQAGLDADPGWVPAFGRVVLFHYV